MQDFIPQISSRTNLPMHQVKGAIALLNEGASIPFISRYRKERTGGLDEVQLDIIQKEFTKLTELGKRKKYILESLTEQGKLSPELEIKINETWDLTELEDIYLPFRPKRRTRAEMARQKGLEPLALQIVKQEEINPLLEAKKYLSKEVSTPEEALMGAQDIVAELISENNRARNAIRSLFKREATIHSKAIKTDKIEEAQKFKDYFEFNELLNKCASYRILAIRRGESEGFLRVSIQVNDEYAIEKLNALFIKKQNKTTPLYKEAIADGYKRLLRPSIETEFANSSKLEADIKSIEIFTKNLRQLLLAPPLGEKRTLAIDPGYRTGCKVVCLDAQGNLLHNETIFPHPPHSKRSSAASALRKMVEAYQIEAIAIGNGTASRETEHFVKNQQFDRSVQLFVVSEQGASIYSASKTAREEFPDYDVTVRGAVSIGRRLMDPLAELVKIDPKSIGVGQYQHDVDQTLLKEALDNTVISCVNQVGVELNTASKHLLTYISGLGPQLAQNIVDYRSEKGPFKSRKELLEVPRMGAKTFEQAAGFLRIRNSSNPLDRTAVHPESYKVVEKMATDLHATVVDLINRKELRDKIKLTNYVTEDVGLPTLTDILKELEKPGLDPREKIKVFEFDQNIRSINDLKEGMILPGIVSNITNFGAFVDLGIKENGLIHLSQLANRFISSPSEVVSIHEHVRVKVISIDLPRKRIQLSMKEIE